MAISLIGVDIGGTFTDIVAFDEESHDLSLLKLPSSVMPEESVMEGLRRVKESGKSPGVLFHSTTVATNALLTRVGWPRVALVTTKGFRDVLEIGRQKRSELYNLRVERPVPVVPRHLRFTVEERTSAGGNVEKPVSSSELEGVVSSIKEQDAEAVCISFINSYANQENEHSAKSVISSSMELPVICSSDIDPLPKEFERTSTAAVNTLLYPIVSAYLGRLQSALDSQFGPLPLYIMQSDGGAATMRGAMERPISIIESGPASGVISALHLGDILGRNNLLTFDMGGTTAKAGIIRDGQVEYSYEFEAAGRTHSGRSIKGSGYPVRFPFIDLAETSSGGGSVAWIDAGGALRVGPVSAGSHPGPVCYGKGGTEPTITDANVVTGRLNQSSLLGGEMPISSSLAEASIAGRIARPLSLGTTEASLGIIAIANNQMAKIMRIVSVERGYDPRRFELVAFGGAGPLHAAELARMLGIESIIVPSSPGLFSALGLVTVDMKKEYKLPVMKLTAETDGRSIANMYLELETRAVDDAATEGWKGKSITFIRSASVQYASQGWELTVPVHVDGSKAGSPREADIPSLVSDFNIKHRQVYGYDSPGDPVNIVSLNLTAVIALPGVSIEKRKGGGPAVSTKARVGERSILFHEGERLAPVYDKGLLRGGNTIGGPAVVEQYDTTTLIPPGWKGKVDGYGNLLIGRRR